MAEQDLKSIAFPTLDDAQVATLAGFGTRRSLRDGEHLFKAGDPEYKFFVVVRGIVEIGEHSNGEPKRVAFHERHAFGGDVSLVTGRPALISAVARGDTEVFEIARQDIRRIMADRPTRKWECLLRGAGGFLWATVVLLLVSLALRYKAWLVHEQADFGEILFWLFLAAWGKALAIGVVGLFLILVIIRALKICQKRKASFVLRDRRENAQNYSTANSGKRSCDG